jgi:NADH:ubiquinone oxidoreductase subunit 4 (subunit M)
MFCPAEIGINGVILFAIGHAISSTGLIYLVGLFYDRKDTRVRRFEFHFQYSGFSGPIIFYFIVFFTIMINIGCLGSTLYVAHSLMISGFTAKNDDIAVAFT